MEKTGTLVSQQFAEKPERDDGHKNVCAPQPDPRIESAELGEVALVLEQLGPRFRPRAARTYCSNFTAAATGNHDLCSSAQHEDPEPLGGTYSAFESTKYPWLYLS